ncbi:hybrid sensor histidine kinase/response regulator [Leptolyngbya sp. 'hensonii']|uniref:hybrid sensor histidine kinase/response regulator n=1 Tax=Leptolyngbya sp. 'hensonii' TaxID=1922337 RepID=UPI0009502EFF|nr:ATP-binding protein [Leptolyngbya sp. 'hensonii']OLP15535.1 hybrid sensor histidine kinase/response regulator [Leptolyngbya sp. 'hensonii']
MQDELTVNVLLVDDHPENLLVLEAILGRLGQNLVKAQSGTEALRCLLNQDFAVVLLDVQMPMLDGFETATLIRQRERSRNTPIIFLTAFNTSDTLIFKGYALGAVDYLMKPINPEILLSKVSVFVDLYKKTAEVERQSRQLMVINAELRQSEARFRSLSACSPVGIFLLDIAGRCTYTNPQCQAICGFTLEESLEEGWTQFLHPDDRARAMADWTQNIRNHQTFSYEYRFQRGDGSLCWAHVRTSPLFSDHGALMGHVGTLEDITERKQAEAIREQVLQEQAARQQAEAANRMKDEFLALVSHELRTPLNSILGWSRLLQTRNLDAATTARALETIGRNARSQARLIDDVLDISRIIRGKLHLSISPVDLVGVIEVTVEAMHPQAEAKSIGLKTRLDSTTCTVSGDPERLKQIIWNLLSNAIKFTPQGGQVEINLLLVTGQSSWGHSSKSNPELMTNDQQPVTNDTYAQLTVTDTGIGISPDFLPYVFDRFRQADSSSTRSHGGLGLGLAIVRHLVELHGGRVQVHSEGKDRGATFTVLLPLLQPARRSNQAQNEIVGQIIAG